MKHEKIIPEAAAANDPACTRSDRVRAEVTLLCDVRHGMRPWARVRLNDISQSGFRIAWFPAVDVNRPLRIKIPGMQLLNAKIRWRSDNALGCEFDEPLHIAVFEHIVRAARGQMR